MFFVLHILVNAIMASAYVDCGVLRKKLLLSIKDTLLRSSFNIFVIFKDTCTRIKSLINSTLPPYQSKLQSRIGYYCNKVKKIVSLSNENILGVICHNLWIFMRNFNPILLDNFDVMSYFQK